MHVLCRILFSIAHVFVYQIKILLNNRNFHTNSTITAKFKQSTRSVTINLDRFYSSTSSMNSGRNYEYLTLSSTDCSGIICKIYGQTKNDMDNMDEVSYPV